MRLLRDKDHNRVLGIAAKVDKEKHEETLVRGNRGGEKARSSSPLCWRCDYCDRMAILYRLYTLLPEKV